MGVDVLRMTDWHFGPDQDARDDYARASARAFEAAYGTGTRAERNNLLLQAYHFYLLPPDQESAT